MSERFLSSRVKNEIKSQTFANASERKGQQDFIRSKKAHTKNENQLLRNELGISQCNEYFARWQIKINKAMFISK